MSNPKEHEGWDQCIESLRTTDSIHEKYEELLEKLSLDSLTKVLLESGDTSFGRATYDAQRIRSMLGLEHQRPERGRLGW